MGSRRARRAQGRISHVRPSKKATLTITKTQKYASRLQQKAKNLASARAVRQANQQQAPYLVALLPLTSLSDDRLHKIGQALQALPREKSHHSFNTVPVRREGGNARQTLLTALDVAKVADMIALIFDGREEINAGAIDLIDALRAQGLPMVHALAIGDGSGDADLRKLRGRQLAAESLGNDHTMRPIPFEIDGAANALKTNQSALRRILAKIPHQVAWRARYGYMAVEEARAADESNEDAGALTLCGWVRGRGFSANELLHLTGLGSFAVSKIVDVESGNSLSERNEEDAEPVESEGEVDELMGEQTWPPEIDEADMTGGESDPDDIEDEGLQLASEHDMAAEEDNKGSDDEGNAPSDAVESSANMDGDDGDDMTIEEDEVKRARDAAKTDLEFPDEVDTPLQQSARVRFARYRGLKSLRTGEWDPKEQLPKDYASIFQFRNLASTRKRVLTQAMKESEAAKENMDANFASSGKRVLIELKDVPHSVRQTVLERMRGNGIPVIASGMLRHENRRSVVHFAVRRLESVAEEEVIKAKTPMEMHCGFVRFEGRPMFSENNSNSDKHKMERFLSGGRLTVASFYGPAVFAPAPALLCHLGGGVVATGSALGADADRIILKRIILTGYPFKTQKKRTVAKFMFFNPDDVRWFKPVELWTKLGRSGHILEPIGTHGHMKCLFDNVVMHHDTICMTLYKRVYPKLMTE